MRVTHMVCRVDSRTVLDTQQDTTEKLALRAVMQRRISSTLNIKKNM